MTLLVFILEYPKPLYFFLVYYFLLFTRKIGRPPRFHLDYTALFFVVSSYLHAGIDPLITISRSEIFFKN